MKKKYPASEPVISRKPLKKILEERCEVVNMLQDRPYTCVVVKSWYDGREFIGYGFSKVCYPDKWDSESGADIAYRRALTMVYRGVRGYERAKGRMEAWDLTMREISKDLVAA